MSNTEAISLLAVVQDLRSRSAPLAAPDRIALAVALHQLGASVMMDEKWGEAAALLTESLSVKETIGDLHSLGLSYANLGICKIRMGLCRDGVQLLIKGAKFIARSSQSESNAQLVANFFALVYNNPHSADGRMMTKMWSDAGMDKLSWPKADVTLRMSRR